MGISSSGQIQTVAAEARQFADEVIARLQGLEDAVSNLQREIAQDQFSVRRERGTADAAGEVEVAAVTVPPGAAWIIDKLSAVAPADMTTPAVYLGTQTDQNLVEIPYFLNGGTPIQATFAAGWVVEGPETIIFHCGGQTEGGTVHTLAMVRMLGGTE